MIDVPLEFLTDRLLLLIPLSQIVFDEKELRREISHAIKNVHGVRQVERTQEISVPTNTNMLVCSSFKKAILISETKGTN